MKKLNLLFVFGLIFFTSFSEVNKNFKPKNVYETYDMIADVYNTDFSTSANVSVDYNNQAVNLGDNSSYSGYYVVYYSSGSVKAIKNFKNGKLEGDSFFYSSVGTLEKIASYKNGSKTGSETEYYDNGSPKAYREYVNGVQNGLEYNYDDTGLLKTVFTYKYGAKNGEAYKFSDSIIIEKEFYANNKLEGEAQSFYANGKKKSSGTFKNDYRDGKWLWYHPDGELKLEETYISGKVLGDIKGFFPDGSVERNISLVNGNGDFIQYYDNGIVKAKGQFYDYSATGEWFFYDKNGNLVTVNYF